MEVTIIKQKQLKNIKVGIAFPWPDQTKTGCTDGYAPLVSSGTKFLKLDNWGVFQTKRVYSAFDFHLC